MMNNIIVEVESLKKEHINHIQKHLNGQMKWTSLRTKLILNQPLS
jgi:hypothetical protein